MTAIFKKLYKKYGNQYWDQFNFSASSYLIRGSSTWPERNAFDFDDSTHWTPNDGVSTYQWIKFCFKNIFVRVDQYELKSSSGSCRPNAWKFSGSLDTNFVDEEAAEYQFGLLESKKFSWKHGPYKCFKFLSTRTSQCNDYKFDICQIELYGTIYKMKKYPFTHRCNIHASNAYLFMILIIR